MKNFIYTFAFVCILCATSFKSFATNSVYCKIKKNTIFNSINSELKIFGIMTYDTPAGVIFTNQFNACTGWTLSYVVTNNTSVYSTQWNVSNTKGSFNSGNFTSFTTTTLAYAFNDTGKFVVRLNLNQGTSIQRYFYDTIYNPSMLKPLPVFLPLDSQRICYGSSYTIDFGNDNGKAKKYLWNTGLLGDTLRTLTRSDSNSYILQITDSFNCQNRDTFRLYVNSPLLANAGTDTAICRGDTANLHASGGLLYQWKNLTTGAIIVPKGYISTVRVNPATTTKYEVTVFTSYPDTANKNLECSKTDTMQVTVNPLPVLTRPTAVLSCKSTKINNLNLFSSNQPGGIGVWSYPQANGALIQGNPPQVRTDSLKNLPGDSLPTSNFGFDNWIRYKYTAPDSLGGCTNYDSAKVSIFAIPYVVAGFDVKWCKNNGVFKLQVDNTRPAPYNTWAPVPNDVSGSNYGQNSTWTGLGVDSIISGSNKRYVFNPSKTSWTNNILTYTYTKQYVVAGASAPACSNSDTVIFELKPIPLVSAGTFVPVCNNDSSFNLTNKAKATTTGTGGYWTYVPVSPLNGINNALRDSQDFFPSRITVPAGNTQYSWKLLYTDVSTGCPASDTSSITVAAKPIVTLNFDNPSDTEVYIYTGIKTLTSTSIPLGGIGVYSCSNFTNAYSVDLNNPSKSYFNTNYQNLIPGKYYLNYNYRVQIPGYNLLCANSDHTIINIKPPYGTGINNVNGFEHFSIFPNPTTGLLNIEFETSEKKVDIEVVDLIGKSVLKTTAKNDGSFFQKTIDISQLTEGIYFVKITTGEKSTTVKVTVK